jgi:hypothetical protein
LYRTSVGIKPFELRFGGQEARFVEGVLDGFFGLKQGTRQRQGDLDGDRIVNLANDLRGHGIPSVKISATGTLAVGNAADI